MVLTKSKWKDVYRWKHASLDNDAAVDIRVIYSSERYENGQTVNMSSSRLARHLHKMPPPKQMTNDIAFNYFQPIYELHKGIIRMMTTTATTTTTTTTATTTTSGDDWKPLIRSETCVSSWVEMNLLVVDLIQLDGKTRETVIHVGVRWKWPCNDTDSPPVKHRYLNSWEW